MRIELFDVEHGHCALVTADNGSCMLIDCGHNDTTGWRPSTMMDVGGINYLDTLAISDCDEDHLSDLFGVVHHLLTPDRSTARINNLCHNFDLSPDVIRTMKAPYGLTRNMELLCAFLPKFNVPTDAPGTVPGSFVWPTCVRFHNSVTLLTTDPSDPSFSNNMSFVTFIHSGDIHILFPGDLEPAGWRRLLSRIDFQRQLTTVNVFVAPHHGRESGYLAEVFQFCRPKVILVSDDLVQYDTQRGVYGSGEATGIVLSPHGSNPSLLGSDIRYVLTTRRDTTPQFPAIVIQQLPGQRAMVVTARQYGFL